MGIWDWLGPLNAGGKARGWDALPPAPLAVERKSAAEELFTYTQRLTVPMLIAGPGASDILAGPLGAAGNSAVFACLQVIASSIGEPELSVYQSTPGGRVEVEASPLGDLLARPNPVFALDTLLGYVSTCLHVAGNAYWRKLRAGDPETGNVVELWPISPRRIAPYTDPNRPTDFISSYTYTSGRGRPEDISTANIVHFRYGLGDADHRVGSAPLQRLLREISSDEQATRYADRLLANLAINGLTLSFDKDSPSIDQTTADELKARIRAAYGGDNVGSAAVLSPGAQLTALGFSPEQMDMKTLHRVPEERISAVLGVPAIVAGLGAGLDHCIIGHMRLATPDRGPVEIRHIEAGDTVWAVQDGRVQASLVTWAGKTGHRDVFTVKTPNRTLTATDNHPFLVRRMEKVPAPMVGARRSAEWRFWLEWVPLRDLNVGDALVSATRLPDVGRLTLPDGTPATESWLEWFGAFVGDGSYMGGEHDVGLTLSIPENDRVGPYYRALTAGLFDGHRYRSGGERPWKRAQDGRTEEIIARVGDGESFRAVGRALGMNNATVRSRYISATREPVQAVYDSVVLHESRNGFRFSSAQASRWVRSLGFGRGARLKRIPPWVFGLAEPLRLAFLRGLLDTDGSVDKRGLVTFLFASEELVHDTWYLALACGLAVSNVRPAHQRGSRLPNPGRQEVSEAWTFAITSVDDVRRIGTHDATYLGYLAASTRQTRRPKTERYQKPTAMLPEGCTVTRIQSITPAGMEDVYDLTVEGAHNFIAQGLAVHNSTYSNVQQAREAFTETKLLPLWKSIAADLTIQLVPDFTSDAATVLAFDTTEVRALAADENALAARLKILVEAGIITTDEARAEIGLEPQPAATAPAALPAPGATRAASRPYIISVSRQPEVKAAEDLPRDYEAMRASDLPGWVDELVAFFAAERRRVLRRLRSGADTAHDLVPEIEVVRLTETLAPLQLDALDEVGRLVQAELGVVFGLPDPVVAQALRDAGQNIRSIDETTRRAVADALVEGQQAGEGIPQLARRLLGLPAFGTARATTVARTELALTTNISALTWYRASGVVTAVQVLDSDNDPACSAWNGRTVPIDQAGSIPPLGHPNCGRALAPSVATAQEVAS